MRLRRLRPLRDQRGYTVIEMVTVMAILASVMTGLTTLFVSGTRAEVDLNARFQAQTEARVALDGIRREVHCASGATNVTTTTVTLTVPCLASPTVTWCTAAVPGFASRFRLYRQAGTTCGTGGKQYADYLTTGNAFAYQDHSATSLAKLHVVLRVDVNPADTKTAYQLCDDIAFRNTTRVTGTGSTITPC